MKIVIEFLSGLLTPLIAVIAVYIAYQQWQTNSRRLDLDLYEHRLRVYQAVDLFIHKVIRNLSPDVQDFAELWRGTAEAKFLFGSDVTDYINDLATHAADLRRWKEEYRDDQQFRPEGYDHTKVVEEQHKAIDWFNAQLKGAPQLFSKHLNLAQGQPWWRRWLGFN